MLQTFDLENNIKKTLLSLLNLKTIFEKTQQQRTQRPTLHCEKTQHQTAKRRCNMIITQISTNVGRWGNKKIFLHIIFVQKSNSTQHCSTPVQHDYNTD